VQTHGRQLQTECFEEHKLNQILLQVTL